jgi:lipid-binding SYLF domain-containing protein
MKKTALVALVSVAMALPALAQNKMDNRLGESAEVLNQLILKPDAIPQAYLNKARCVLVFPSVKKVAVGIGGSYGRGVILCRSGANMTGPWSAPAM